MRKGRIIKGLAFAITAIMLLGCFSASYTSARTQGWTDHIDIRTNAAFINDGNQSGLTITKDDIKSVQYKTSSTNGYVDLYEHNDAMVHDGREKYETKYGSEKYGADLFKVDDESVVVRITGTFSNGETFDVEIDQNSTYPDNTYIECKNKSTTEKPMEYYGAKVEKLPINGKETDYYNVSGVGIIDVAIAMCNGVSYKNNKVVPCGTDFYLNPDIIMILGNQDELTVTKNWTNVEGEILPTSIEAELYIDGKATGKKVTLSAENNWTDVIKYTRNEDSEYTVVENSIVINGETKTPAEAGYSYEARYAMVDGVEIIDTTKENIKSGVSYYAEFASNLFAVNKMKDKDVYYVWTYKAIAEDEEEAFINAINAKGEITGLTKDNTVFISGIDSFSYGDTTPVTGDVKVVNMDPNNKDQRFNSESAASTAMENKKAELTKNNTAENYVTITSSKVTQVGAKETKIDPDVAIKDPNKGKERFDSESAASTAMENMKAELTKNNTDNKIVTISSSEVTHVGEVNTEPNKPETSEEYKNQEKALKAYDKRVNQLTKGNNDKKYVTVTSDRKSAVTKGRDNKYHYTITSTTTTDNRKWGYTINYVTTTVADTRKWGYTINYTETTVPAQKKLAVELKTNYKGMAKAFAFNYQDKTDWEFLYKGRFFTGEDYSRVIIDNTYSGLTTITGSKTFDMQGVDNVAVPLDENKNPKITLNVTQNGAEVSNFTVKWTKDNSVENKWNFEIKGEDITVYCDTDKNTKYDALSKFEVSEAGVSESGVITIDGYDYTVSGTGTDIINTLDTSDFTGNLKIVKSINDINTANGKAIFTYRIDPLFEGGKSYYAVVVVDSKTKVGETTLKNLKIGEYKVTELDTMRFAFASVDKEGGVVKVTKDGTETITFNNTLSVKANYSHTDVTINTFKKDGDKITKDQFDSSDDQIQQDYLTILEPTKDFLKSLEPASR